MQRLDCTRCATRWRPGTSSPSFRSTQRESTSWSPSLWPTDTSVHNITNLCDVWNPVCPSRVTLKLYLSSCFTRSLTFNSSLNVLHPSCSFLQDSPENLYFATVVIQTLCKCFLFLLQEQGETALHLAVRLVDRTSLHIVDFLTQNRYVKQENNRERQHLHFTCLSVAE